MAAFPVGLVGESNYQAAIRECRVGQRVEVLHETGNRYDKKALVVVSESGRKLGYIPRECWLRDAIHDEQKGCGAKIKALNSGADGAIGVVIDVNLNQEGIDQCAYRR